MKDYCMSALERPGEGVRGRRCAPRNERAAH
jgi:hypothetical protein